VSGPTDGSDRAAAGALPTAEPRQRWRIVFARDDPSERAHREIAEAWIAAVQQSGLPLPRGEGRPRPPLTFAAPLPVGASADAELADLVLAARLPIAAVRPTVAASMPGELRLVDLYDVWLGSPPLAAAVEGAIHRVELETPVAAESLAAAASRLLASPSLERERARGSGVVRYDLRPLVDDVSVEGEGSSGSDSVSLRIRTRFHPERGAGRPEEVVAALAELLGEPLPIASLRRVRLILGTDR
jgi:radical SAM-linked protein